VDARVFEKSADVFLEMFPSFCLPWDPEGGKSSQDQYQPEDQVEGGEFVAAEGKETDEHKRQEKEQRHAPA
jgi:hypothetical protein